MRVGIRDIFGGVPALDENISRSEGFSEALVQAALRASIGVVIAVPRAEHLECVFSNERARALLGVVPARLPEDLALGGELARFTRWLRGSKEPFVLEGIRPERAPFRASPDKTLGLTASRVSTSRGPAVALFLRDSVVRARTERALVESQARFRRLLDAVPDAVALGTRRRFIYANPACVELLRYDSMEDVIRAPLKDRIHPEDREVVARILRELGPSSGHAAAPVRILGKNASVVHLDLRLISIEWDGEPTLLGIGRDVGPRRRAQAQLIRADRLSAIGTLAAGVAHEINNPLAYLMLNLQYLMRELPRFDGDKTRLETLLERLAEAEHGARRVRAIVGDLRSLSRPPQVGLGPISVEEAATRAVKLVGTQIHRCARVVEDYSPAPLINGNASRLEQVLTNLLVNAADSIPEGRQEDNEIRISVSVRAPGDTVVIAVRDTGAGIAEGARGRIFDPFFTTKPRGVGTGLGLPISRGIVKSFGGDIDVTSELGVGTTFTVSFPALVAAVAEAAVTEAIPVTEPSREAGSDATSRPSRARVLIVDDERPVADMLHRALSDAHDVTVATDAQTALEFVVSGGQFDLIFCDLLMPRMSGMDLYAEVRARCPGVEDSIVFMTGGAFTERAAEFLSKVPNRKMTKPFDLVELERMVAGAARNLH